MWHAKSFRSAICRHHIQEDRDHLMQKKDPFAKCTHSVAKSCNKKKMTIAILSSSKKLALKMPDFLVTASNLLSFYKNDIRKGITFTDVRSYYYKHNSMRHIMTESFFD